MVFITFSGREKRIPSTTLWTVDGNGNGNGT
jgi:hypothetical protein